MDNFCAKRKMHRPVQGVHALSGDLSGFRKFPERKPALWLASGRP